MPNIIVVSGKKLIRMLEKHGFVVIRTKWSHHRLVHTDGRITTVPVHGNVDLPKGLLRKIATEDLGMTVEDFNNWFI